MHVVSSAGGVCGCVECQPVHIVVLASMRTLIMMDAMQKL